MRVSSVSVSGCPTYGVVRGPRFFDVGSIFQSRWPTLRDVLDAGALDELDASCDGAESFEFAEVKWAPVVANPRQIFCVGLNYGEHVLETGREMPTHPSIFLRLPATQIGHESPLIIPCNSRQLDYEGELAVIIGTRGHHISAQDAHHYIAGYSCYNDASVRDWQNHTSQWTPGKNFPGTGALGPYLTTGRRPPALSLTTRVNGEVRQSASTDDLIFSVSSLIEYVSDFAELLPGDVIATGTPSGVGARMNPPQFLLPSDVVEVEIDGLGVLRNEVVDEVRQ